MYKGVYAAFLILTMTHASADEQTADVIETKATTTEAQSLAQDLMLLLGQDNSSAGQSLAFLQKHEFDYKNEDLNWGQNGNAIRYLESDAPIYVFNQGHSIVGVAGQLPEEWLMQLQKLRTVRCQTQPFERITYICRHQSATEGTLEHFQYRVRYRSAQPQVS